MSPLFYVNNKIGYTEHCREEISARFSEIHKTDKLNKNVSIFPPVFFRKAILLTKNVT